nr:hypothetical protein [Tanacetum cinerariifolium]
MDTKKHIVDLESFREMLHISPRVPGQSFAELPFEEEILEFLRFLGHSAQIKTLTDVNVNKVYQSWRSFAAVINKCLTGKSTGFDSLRLSQAQILWGLYHRRNVDYAFLIWEDLVYQVEHKSQKKSNEMYYPRFTKVIIHYFMTKKPLIPSRNRVNWHYVRDDILFSTIKVVSRHQNTQQYGAILPIELTTEDIRNTTAYKEYYACATGEAAPKPKASARNKKGGFAASTTPPTPIATPTPTITVVATPRLSAATKGEGTGSKPGVPDVPSDDSGEELSWNSFDDEDVDTQTQGRDESEGEKTDESDDDDDAQEEAEKVNDDDDNEEEVPKIDEQETTESDEGDNEATESDRESLRIGEEERMHEEEKADELYHDVDINQGRGLQVSQETEGSHVILTPTQSDAQQESSSTSSFMTNLLNPLIDPGMESIFTTGLTTVTPIPSPLSTMTPSIISTFTTASQLPTPPTQIPSLDLQSLPTFASVFHFEDKVKLLEVNLSNLSGIVNQYMYQQMPEAVREAVQTQIDRLQDSIQRENDEFLKTIDDNIKKIMKEQVKTQVKAQVTRILPRIEESVNAQLEAEVLTRSSHSSRTLYAVAANLDDEKIMIRKDPPLDQTGGLKDEEKEGSMHQLALHLNQLPGVQADLLQGLNLNSCLPVSLLLQRNLCRLPVRWRNPHIQCLRQVQKINSLFKHLSILNGSPSQISALAKQTDARSSFNEIFDTPIDFSNLIMNRLGVDTLTPDLLAGPTYELMRGLCNSLTELEYHLEEVYKATTDQLDWVNPEGQ